MTAEIECVPFEGPENLWREKAVRITFIEQGVAPGELAWPTPTCGTALCLTFEHLVWASPKRLNYPEGVCVYCGVIAGTKDHLLPRTWSGEAVRKNVLTVPACGECNSAIGDRYAPSITERREVAHAFILRRKRKILQMPEWTSEDLAELGHTLRTTIRKGLHERALTQARLDWPDDNDFDLRAMQLSGIANPYEVGLIEKPYRLVRRKKHQIKVYDDTTIKILTPTATLKDIAALIECVDAAQKMLEAS